MSEKVKGVKIRFENGNLSQEIPIGALAQNVDYNEQNVKQTLDRIDLSDRIKKGTGTSGIILNNISLDSDDVNNGNLASGAYSIAEGYGTKAISEEAHAEGQYSIASGKMSHAEGHQTIASGNQSHVEGEQSQATGVASHAEGNRTYAQNTGAHAEGNYTHATGAYSHSEGAETEANSAQSHAQGYQTFSSGINSHAEGYKTKAVQAQSHAEGAETVASGVNSHAEGISTTAPGQNSHAEGNGTVASGVNSHAEGGKTTASGPDSHAEGSFTIAASPNQHVSGAYNIADANNKYAEIIGNGTTNDNRSNARTLDWNGNEWIKGSLKIGGTSYNDSNAKTVVTTDNITAQVQSAISQLAPSTITIDSTLSTSGAAADAKATGDKLDTKLDAPSNSGTAGQVLKKTANGTEWADGGSGSTIELDTDFNSTTKAAQSKAVGDALNKKANAENVYTKDIANGTFVKKPTTNPNGAVGQFLQTDGQGGTVWASVSSEGGASSSEVEALQSAVQQLQTDKADASRVQTLETTVAGKANSTEVYTQTQANGRFIQKPATSVQANKILSATGTDRGVQWVDPPTQLTIGTGANQAASGKALQDLSSTVSGLSSAITGQNGLNSQIGSLDENKIDKPQVEGQPSDGTQGQILKTNGDGTTEWISLDTTLSVSGKPSDAKAVGNVLKNFKRRFLFLGDELTPPSVNGGGWIPECAKILGLKKNSSGDSPHPVRSKSSQGTADSNYTIYESRIDKTPYDDYEINRFNLVKFGAGNSFQDTTMNFKELLEDAHERKYIGYDFTDIVACGGLNEQQGSNLGTHSTVDQIKQGISDFVSLAKTYYPNANIYIGHIGWATSKGAGANIYIRDKSIPAYREGTEQAGAKYLYNVEYYPLADEVYNITNSSGVVTNPQAPTSAGYNRLSKAIAKAILYGRAPLPNEWEEEPFNVNNRPNTPFEVQA